MDAFSHSTTVPMLTTALVAVMVYATLRLFQSCYLMVRDGLLQWQGQRALDDLQQEVDNGRRTPFELFIQHGLHHLRLHDALRARAFFEAASRAHPMSPHGFYGQGLAWRESLYFPGPLQEQALSTALERDPEHVDARLLLIEFFVQSGQLERARDEYDLLPPKNRTDALARLLAASDAAPIEAQTFVRASTLGRCVLLALDLLLAGLIAYALEVPEIAVVAAWLGLLVLPYHSLLWWRIDTDAEGIEIRTLRSQRRYVWKDVTDMIEAPEGGFFLQTRARSVYVSRHWDGYHELLKSVKHHLYVRGWVPLLREYARPRLRRPLLS